MFCNIWRYVKIVNARIMRTMLNLTSYTIENCVFHVLHARTPKFSYHTLTRWYKATSNRRWKVLQYLSDRSQYDIMLLFDTNFLSQTCEAARIYGCDFHAAMTRGSQFKVEMVMTRICRPENLIPLSPGREDVKAMRAPECIALVMEPESRFYKAPLCVLDFASLYPSVMVYP